MMTWEEIILKGNVFRSALYLEIEKYGRNSNYENSDIRWLHLGVMGPDAMIFVF